MNLRYLIALLVIAPPVVAFICIYIWKSWKAKVDDAKLERDMERSFEKRRPIPMVRPSISCPPEVIRPPEPKKGIRGLPGRKIAWPHSHLMDLANRLKENKK